LLHALIEFDFLNAGSSWSGHRKLIGMRFLFPPLSDDLSLLEKARVWVARHEHKYFVGWTEAELARIDPQLRPLTPITPQLYKLHMNRLDFHLICTFKKYLLLVL
jgi:hypothetical protein